MLKFFLGGEASRKTEEMLESMVSAAAADLSERFLIIVPEQATMQMQTKIVKLHPAHSVMNIDIVSFARLSYKVFAELGISFNDCLDDTGKALVLRKVLEEKRGELTVYKNKIHQPGFVKEIQSIVTELKQYDIDDNILFTMQEKAEQNGNRLLFSKLSDVRLIYEAFNKEIEDKFTTPEEILDILAKVADKSEIIKNAHIYLDGFTGFTPIQLKVMDKFLASSKDVNISLTLPEDELKENPEEFDLFYLSNKTIQKLREKASERNIKIELKFSKDERKKAEEAKIIDFETPEAEVKFVAGKILSLAQEGFRFRDFAVVAADMESYYKSFLKVMKDAGVSCFIDYKSELSNNMLSKAVLLSMQLAVTGFSSGSLFAFLKTGITGIKKNSIDLLENYCLEFGIKSFKAFEKEFVFNRHDVWNLERINEIRTDIYEKLSEFYKNSRGKKKAGRTYSENIKNLLKNLDAEAVISKKTEEFYASGDSERAKEYEQIYELILNLLDKISMITGNEEVSPAEYTAILSEGFKDIKVGIIPPTLDAVTIGDLTRTRFPDVKYLFIVGANDGKLPAVSKGSRIFTGNERKFLKDNDFELAPSVLENLYTQRFYLYLMLLKPEEGLYITYPRFSMSGEELSKSYFLNEISEISGGLKVKDERPGEVKQWKAEGFKTLAENLLDEDIEKIKYFYDEDPLSFLQVLSGCCYDQGSHVLSREIADSLYGEVLKGSISRYETFYVCPFRHFLNYGLGLLERPEYRIEAKDVGTLYHAAIEYYSKSLKEKGLSFRTISDKESIELCKKATEKAIADAGTDLMQANARNEYLLKRISDVTLKTTEVLRSHVRDGLFNPEYYELKFETTAEGGTMFKGKIDRVDVYDGGDVLVKIIDYKTGNVTLNVKDIYTGQQLQLVAYMNEAIKKVAGDNPERNVKPGGIYYYHINDKFVKSESEAEDKFKMSGLTNCSDEALMAVDKRAFDAKINSHIVNLKYKSGSVTSASSILNDENFDALIKFVDRKISEVGKSIREGNASVYPLYSSNTNTACGYCPYMGVCKFTPGKLGADWNKEACDMSKEEIEKEIYGL